MKLNATVNTFFLNRSIYSSLLYHASFRLKEDNLMHPFAKSQLDLKRQYAIGKINHFIFLSLATLCCVILATFFIKHTVVSHSSTFILIQTLNSKLEINVQIKEMSLHRESIGNRVKKSTLTWQSGIFSCHQSHVAIIHHDIIYFWTVPSAEISKQIRLSRHWIIWAVLAHTMSRWL